MIDDLLKEAEVKMQKSIEAMHRELSTIRTGRASPALLERVQVDYYGAATPCSSWRRSTRRRLGCW